MEFAIDNVVYTVNSGSLDNVITSVNFLFKASQSFSGSIFQAQEHHGISLDSVKASNFVTYASCSEAIVKGWVEETYITQSSMPGPATSSLWGQWTSSVSSMLDQNLTEQTVPTTGFGKPWE